MNIRNPVALLRANWFLIVAAVLLGALVGTVVARSSTPEYTATTDVFVAAEAGTTNAELAQGSNFTQQQARNYATLATKSKVLDPVVNALDLDTTAAGLARRTTSSVAVNTSIISVAVTDPSARQSARIANAVARSLANVVGGLVPKRRDGTSAVQLSVVQDAEIPSAPSTPSPVLVLLVGCLVGLVLGLGAAFLRDRLDRRVRDAEEVRQLTGVGVLGSLGFHRDRRPAASVEPGSRRAEELRRLRTNLRFLQADAAHKAFVVTSSVRLEGRTSSALDLAQTLAAGGQRVCLVEADLRRPVLAERLGLAAGDGLSAVINADVELSTAIQTWGSHDLRVLPAGAPAANPSETLGSHAGEAVLSRIVKEFDVTVVDCPPLHLYTDAALIADHLGGAVLVVGLGRVHGPELTEAVEALEAAGAPLLGVVVNQVRRRV